MNMTDELERLSRLHKDGTLNHEEFAQAKNKLLSQSAESPPVEGARSCDEEARRRKIVVCSVIGAIIFLFLFMAIWSHTHRGHTFGWTFR